MQGRLEKEILSEKRVREKLRNELPIITSYYNSFDDESYTTKESYINYVLDFINFLKQDKILKETEQDIKLNDANDFKLVTTDHVRQYMRNLERTINGTEIKTTGASIRATRYSGINSFFKFLLTEEYIKINPFDKVKRPAVKKDIEIVRLKQEEISILINNIKSGVGSNRAKERQKEWIQRDLAIVVLGLTTGLRVEAIVDINIEDINFNNSTIRVTEKGNKDRIIYLSEMTVGYLKDWCIKRSKLLNGYDNTNSLFISNRRVRMSTQSVRKLLGKYTYNIDKHITPHKMRSTFATNVYSATGDIYATANALGHNSINTTRRYALVEEEKKREVANVAANFVNIF